MLWHAGWGKAARVSVLRPIGDFGKFFAKLDQETYLARDPAAVLMQDVMEASFQLAQPGADSTVEFMLGRGKDPGQDDSQRLKGIQRDIAYMVAILRARDKPADARMLVGSAAHCDVVIPEQSVSREHVWVQRQGEEYIVEEAGSTNGTFVEQTCLLPGHRHTLRPGDRLTLGNTELTFLDPEGFYVFTKRFLRVKP